MLGPKDQRAYNVRVYKWIYSRDAIVYTSPNKAVGFCIMLLPPNCPY